jgi:hypothetical protein
LRKKVKGGWWMVEGKKTMAKGKRQKVIGKKGVGKKA